MKLYISIVSLVITIFFSKGLTSTLSDLQEFYNSTNQNDNWYINIGWNGNDYCQFKGVQCENGVLIGIYLQSNGLKGRLPPSFSNLTSLVEINLSLNQIFDLPDLSKFQNLSSLSISERPCPIHEVPISPDFRVPDDDVVAGPGCRRPGSLRSRHPPDPL